MDKPFLYDTSIDFSVFLQGDIFPEVEFNKIFQEDVILEKRYAMAISQTCDIADGDNILLSPIYTVDEYLHTSPKEPTHKVKLMRTRKGLFDKFYLGELPLPGSNSIESYVDLKVVSMISKNDIKSETKIVSLSHWGRHVLNSQLVWLFGRPVVDWDFSSLKT